MKKLFYILFPLLLLASCDLIPEEDRYLPYELDSLRSSSLILEFTGFRCVNCPRAATQAHELLDKYPDNLVVVELHPWTNTFCQTPIEAYNYTCPAADSVYVAFGGTSTTSFPTGIVDFSSGFSSYKDWPALVSSSVSKDKEASLVMNLTCDSDSCFVTWRAYVFSADSSLAGSVVDLSIMLWLVEDSIVGPQMMPDGSQNMQYVHSHVLRGSLLPSVWGSSFQAVVNSSNPDYGTLSFSLPDSINGQAVVPEHCSVVGILTGESPQDFKDVKRCPLGN